MLFSRSQNLDPKDERDMIITYTDRRQETQLSDRQAKRGPSTFGKALKVKDYGTRLWSRI